MGKDSMQNPKVRDQMSEAGVKLTSDIRLLISEMDGFNDLNVLNDLTKNSCLLSPVYWIL
jgi:hypothetical protein